ncbi:unnamed protein product [Absidia cylindrospora]
MKNILCLSMNPLFVDDVLVSALSYSLSTNFYNRTATSYKAFQQTNKDDKGQFDYHPVYIPNGQFKAVFEEMTSIISESDRLDALFGGFFLVTHGHGLKVPLDDVSVFAASFAELDVDLLVASESVFVDFVIEKFGPHPSTSVWKTTNQGVIKHRSLLVPFFGDVILSSNYRLDKFANFEALAGFNYHVSSPSSPSSAGFVSLKGYQTFKHPFYHRQQSSSRHTKGVNAFDIWSHSPSSTTLRNASSTPVKKWPIEPIPSAFDGNVAYCDTSVFSNFIAHQVTAIQISRPISTPNSPTPPPPVSSPLPLVSQVCPLVSLVVSMIVNGTRRFSHV